MLPNSQNTLLTSHSFQVSILRPKTNDQKLKIFFIFHSRTTAGKFPFSFGSKFEIFYLKFKVLHSQFRSLPIKVFLFSLTHWNSFNSPKFGIIYPFLFRKSVFKNLHSQFLSIKNLFICNIFPLSFAVSKLTFPTVNRSSSI